jgi:hypothetical protein
LLSAVLVSLCQLQGLKNGGKLAQSGLAGLSKNGWLKFKCFKIIVKNRAIKKIYDEKKS